MPDKNLTVNEIVKACEVCACVHGKSCEPCPYYKNSGKANCLQMRKDALDLINRLQAENERLLRKTQRPQDADPMDFCGVLCDFAEGLIVKAKAKAYKEFAERLNKEIDIRPTYSNKQNEYVCFLIDNLLKELVGDK